jgi:hypothetical protein
MPFVSCGRNKPKRNKAQTKILTQDVEGWPELPAADDSGSVLVASDDSQNGVCDD